MKSNVCFDTDAADGSLHKSDENRVNFTDATKRIMRERAGTLCSYRRCLKSTLLPIAKKSNTQGSARVGDAAHIYGASAKGPRRDLPVQFDKSKLSDVENGVWMCCDHARQIDAAEVEHTAEELTEMKRVREFAQKLVLTDSFLHSFAPYVPPMVLDEVVWKHLPVLNVEEVRQAMIDACLPYFPGSEALLERDMPNLPSHFKLTPIAKVVKEVAAVVTPQSVLEGARIDLYVQERNRAFQIVDGWAHVLPQARRHGDIRIVGCCYVKLMARHPDTGEIDDAFIWAKATYTAARALSMTSDERLDISVGSTESHISDLDWQLNISVRNNKCRVQSVLKAYGPIKPREIRDDLEWAHFNAYARVIGRLAEGWEPIGFVSQRSNECDDVSWVHPEPFEIEMRISPQELAERQYRCHKVWLARELSFQWGCQFVFTADYFDHALTEQMIRAASGQLQSLVLAASWPPEDRIGPIVPIQAREVYFTSRIGYISFDTRPIPRHVGAFSRL